MELLFLNIGAPEMMLIFFAFLVTAPVVVLQLYCLINAARSNKLTNDQRIVWVLILLFVPILGSIKVLPILRTKYFLFKNNS